MLRRCIVCGDRIWPWQWRWNVSWLKHKNFVHTRRKYGGSPQTCNIVFGIAVEMGMSDQFVDWSEIAS